MAGLLLLRRNEGYPYRERKRRSKKQQTQWSLFSITAGLESVPRGASIVPVLDDCTPLKIIRSLAKQYDVTRVKQVL